MNLLTGFTGYTWDAVLEAYFAQARIYDPNLKRFLQADPIGGKVARPASLNPYPYCENDPGADGGYRRLVRRMARGRNASTTSSRRTTQHPHRLRPQWAARHLQAPLLRIQTEIGSQ